MRAGIIGLGAAAVALFLGLMASDVWLEYGRSIERAEATSQNLASALDHHATQAIQVVDDTIGNLLNHIESIRGSPRLDRKLTAMLRHQAEEMAFVKRIVVADQDGMILQDSTDSPQPPGSIADQPYFTAQRDYPSAGIHVSPPFRPSSTDGWTIAMSRRIDAPGREFGGVVVAFISVNYFQQIYDSLQIGRDGMIQLFNRDGTTLIREPFHNKVYAQTENDKTRIRSLIQWSRNGTTSLALPPDEVERIVSYRTVPKRPLVVAVGLSRVEVLAQWRADLHKRILLSVVIVAAVGLLTLLLLRSLGRRERSEANLRESQLRFELAVSGTSDGLWDWDMTSGRVWFSPRCCELLGYDSPDEFSANHDGYLRRIHAEDAQRRANALERHLREGLPYDIEYRIRRKGGDYRWFRVRGQALRNSAGEPVRMAGSISDIDSQRAAETALVEALDNLRESEARLSSLIENVPGVIYRSIYDGHWTETFLNHALGELTGYAPEDFMSGGSRSFASVIHPQDREAVREAIADAVHNCSAYTLEYRIQHRNGTVKWVWDRGRAAYDEDGRPLCIDGCIFDITERRRGEADLRRAKDAAEAASDAKSQFLAHMSHELRTPLNAIIGFSEVMKREIFGSLGSDQYRDYAQDIHESGSHLLGVINDILDLSKVEAGRQELHEQDCDVAALVAESIRLVAERAAAQHVRIDCHPRPDLPTLWADHRMIKQVLINLLSNAIKFTPEGGVVDLSVAVPADAGLRIVIADNGIGIPSDQVGRVLEPFVQVEGAFSRKYSGTGLGLPLSKTFVELHGGRLDLESGNGNGTTVTITLPKDRIRGRASAA